MYRSVDLESSLLGAELVSQLAELQQLRRRADQLRHREAEMSTRLEAWQLAATEEAEKGRAALAALEAGLEQLEAEQREGQGILDTDKVDKEIEIERQAETEMERGRDRELES